MIKVYLQLLYITAALQSS